MSNFGNVFSYMCLGALLVGVDMLNSFLIMLGVPTFLLNTMYVTITTIYAIENLCLYHDLKTKNQHNDSPELKTSRDAFIERLLRQNSLLEKKNIDLEKKIQRHEYKKQKLVRSVSLNMDDSRKGYQRMWHTTADLLALHREFRTEAREAQMEQDNTGVA